MALMKKHYDTPAAIEQAFYEALEHADLDGLMALWSDDDDIVYIAPGGARMSGHHAVRTAWRETFANGPVHARPTKTQVVQGPSLAIHSVIEQVLVNNGGATAVVELVASNVYMKGASGWRLVLHHASALPEATAPRETRIEGYLH